MYWDTEPPPPVNHQPRTIDNTEYQYSGSNLQFKPLGACQRAPSRRRFYWIPKRERKRILPSLRLGCGIVCSQSWFFTDRNI